MRLALTGGGTGGHVFPALEVGRLAVESGDDVRYFGSLRGLENTAAPAAGFGFHAVEANPIPRLASMQGMRAILTLLKSARLVAAEFRTWAPDVLLATGGYSSGPALRAARAMNIPIVLHEQNSIPGRNTKMMGRSAHKICIVFDQTYQYFVPEKVVHTGMPVRKEIIEAAKGTSERGPGFTTLAAGGSQGARFLNGVVTRLVAATSADDDRWIHVTGPKLYDEVRSPNTSMPPGYRLVPFLDAGEMAQAMGDADIVIVRAGCGLIAELALFGLPAIFVPLPTSFANHQFHNAKEIENLGGGSIIEEADSTDQRFEGEWRAWKSDESRRRRASASLKAWAKPDAAEHVLSVVKGACR